MDDPQKLHTDLIAQIEENERLREQLLKAEAIIKSLQDKLKVIPFPCYSLSK
jgi:hypothetical protein